VKKILLGQIYCGINSGKNYFIRNLNEKYSNIEKA
jgi:hypothetical protein